MRSDGDTPVALPSWEDLPARLFVVHGARIGRQLILHREHTTIGRADDCHLRLVSPQLSRHHAAITRTGAGYTIADLGSRNGTFVNGVPVGSDPVALALGDRIRLGSDLVLSFTLSDPVEEQLLQRQRLETLGRLTAGIAHDFNNMLGAVMANVEFLSFLPDEARLADANVRECVADIAHATSRAAELSQRLVGYARGDRLGMVRLEVGEICQAVARLAGRTFGQQIAIRCESDPDLTIDAEGLDLHQVLMNLALNARDAMPAGGVLSIEARRARRADGGDGVVIHVRDTGHGMDAETAQRIFEPFFSTKGTRGFGLGLSTSREIVDRLGGALTVESAPGAGASFRIELPASGLSTGARRIPTARPADAVPPLHILVVDDEAVVRRCLRRLLEQAGHVVDEAEGGEVAIGRYAGGGYDLVVLDLEMPELSGERTLERLLAIDPAARVLLMSGRRDQERIGELSSSGAAGFLSKPWATGELLDAIAAAVEADTAPGSERVTQA